VPLPANARIQVADSFVRNVMSASAAQRYDALLVRIKEAREHLRFNPAAGRPARFLSTQSAQGQSMAARALAFASEHGVPELRELVLKPYVLLYAHGANRVVLLALKHERQLVFRLD
jgi:hypothetical protein